MRSLLERWHNGTLDREGRRELVSVHKHHFRRRVARLGPSFFPGTEKSPEAIEGLADGAFASFSAEPFRGPLTAFEYALSPQFRNPIGILYYWRASATMVFLRKEGPPILGERDRLKRNVLEALKKRSVVDASEKVARYEATNGHRRSAADLGSIVVDVAGLQTPEAVERVLEAAGRPLNAEQIRTILERNLDFLEERPSPPHALGHRLPEERASAEDELLDRELFRRVEAFYQRLSASERRLLAVRGYGRDAGKPVPFEQVAKIIGGRSKEYFRAQERSILETFRDLVEPDEQRAAVAHLSRLIASGSEGAEITS